MLRKLFLFFVQDFFLTDGMKTFILKGKGAEAYEAYNLSL